MRKNPEKYKCSGCETLMLCEESLSGWGPERAAILNDIFRGDYEVRQIEMGECLLKNVCAQARSDCVTPGGNTIHLQGTYTLGELALSRMLTGAHVTADNIIKTNKLVFPYGQVNRS